MPNLSANAGAYEAPSRPGRWCRRGSFSETPGLGEMTAPELGEMTATRDASVAELEEEDEEEAPTSEGASTSEVATAFCAKA